MSLRADPRCLAGNPGGMPGGNLEDLWSIRINDQWRLFFSFVNGEAFDVEIADGH
jgi:proteic killer suppression protein